VRKLSRWMATSSAAGAMLIAVAAPAHAAPTVLAQWNMDAVPTMVDSAGGDNNGKATAITMSPDGYYTFNGTSSIASVPATKAKNLNPGALDIKVEARINATTAPSPGETFDIIRKGTSGTAGGYYKIELKTTSTGVVNAACIFKDKAKVVGQAIGRIATTGWQTLTCTKTATTVTLAVDGVTKKTTIKSVGTTANTAGVIVGGKGNGTDVFSGLMDYASITIG
jgi:Concanavalin A-like lectin/glucanases superfamily